jgi:hypothetical protein
MASRASLPLAGALALALISPAQAQSPLRHTYGNITVGVIEVPPGTHTHGYTEYRFRVRNDSEQATHAVTLFLPEIGPGQVADHIRRIARTVTVGPGESVAVSLLQPAGPPVLGGNVGVVIDGDEMEEPLRITIAQDGDRVGLWARRYGMRYHIPIVPVRKPPGPLVLVSPGVDRQLEALFPWPSPAPGLPMGRPGRMGPAPAPPPRVPGGPGPVGKRGGKPTPPPPARPGAGPLPVGAASPGAKPPPPGGAPPPRGPGRVIPAPPGLPPGMGGMGGMTVAAGVFPNFVRSDLPVTEWSRNWLGYTRYDGIVITARELEDAPEVRPALWRYAEAGGSLLIVGPGADPRSLLPKSWIENSLARGLGGSHYEAGFGRCSVRLDDMAKWEEDVKDHLRLSWKGSSGPFQHTSGVTEANQLFPVLTDTGIPVRGLFVLMVGFAIAIGPVNLWLLDRKKKRILLLVTVPLISLLTCAAVFGTMLVVEGWQGRERIEAITLLDQGSRRATTLGWTGFYTPVTPADGLHFSRDTELTAFNAVEQRHRGDARTLSYTMDWTDGQDLPRGWITARIPAFFAFRKSEANRRERITVDRTPSGLEVTNALGVPIRRLILADAEGKLHEATDIGEGQKVPLRPTGKSLDEADHQPLSMVFNGSWGAGWPAAASAVEHSPPRFLRPRRYIAILDECPFVEHALRRSHTRRAKTKVYGILE